MHQGGCASPPVTKAKNSGPGKRHGPEAMGQSKMNVSNGEIVLAMEKTCCIGDVAFIISWSIVDLNQAGERMNCNFMLAEFGAIVNCMTQTFFQS